MKNIHTLPAIPKEEPKQETLEEVAEIGKFAEKKYLERLDNFQKVDFKDGFIEGAKWQQERMYSEEDLKSILQFFVEDTRGDKPWVDADDEWLSNL